MIIAMMFLVRRCFVLSIILVLGVTGCATKRSDSSQAHSRSESLHVLFIGNSYTYVNMLPEMIREMSLAKHEHRPLEYKLVAPGGCSFEKHWKDGLAVAAIREGGWDYVVLQEQSLRPLTNAAAMHEYARLLHAEIQKAGAKTVFYITWARKNAPATQQQITQSYATIARELGALSCPVGPAEARVAAKVPEMEFYAVDGSHPSPAATYLGACVFYGVLYGKNPVGLPPTIVGRNKGGKTTTLADLDSAQARLLQRSAAATLREWKRGRPPTEHALE